VQVASVFFNEARTALLQVKPVQFRVCEDTFAVRGRDVSDTFLGPSQIARLPLFIKMLFVPKCDRALILDKPARPGLTAGSCSLEWQLPFLQDRGVGHREPNAGLGRRDRKWGWASR